MIPSFLLDGNTVYSNYLALNNNQKLKREVLGIKDYDKFPLDKLPEIVKKYEEAHQFYYIDCVTLLVKEGKPLYDILLEANKSINYCITRICRVVNDVALHLQYIDGFFNGIYLAENPIWSEIFMLFLTSHHKIYKGMPKDDIEIIKGEQTKILNRQSEIVQNKIREIATKYNYTENIQETLDDVARYTNKLVWNSNNLSHLNDLSQLVLKMPEFTKYRRLKHEIMGQKMVNEPLILYNERSNIVFSSRIKFYNYLQNRTNYQCITVKGLSWLYRCIRNISTEEFIKTESLGKLDKDTYNMIRSKYSEYKRYHFNEVEFNDMVRVYMNVIKDVLNSYRDVLLYEVCIDNNLVFLIPSEVDKSEFITDLINIINKHQGNRKIFEFILDYSIEHEIDGLKFLNKVLANDKDLIAIS